MTTERTKKESLRRALSILCNALSVVLVIYAVSAFFTVGGEGNMQVRNTHCFIYFTVDSNILAALTSVLMLVYQIKGKGIPQWALITKFVGATAVGVTFFTVVFFLGPLMGYKAMFAGNNLYLHMVVPLLEMASFCLWETGRPLSFRESLWGVLPTVVYGTVYLVMVIVIGPEKGGWFDFYGFNMGGLWYVSYIAMAAATLGLCQLLRFLNRAAGKKH